MASSDDDSRRGFRVASLRWEHYTTLHHVGAREIRPRLSWKFDNAPDGFVQHSYTVEISIQARSDPLPVTQQITVESQQSILVPWPLPQALESRQKCFARVKASGSSNEVAGWSDVASIEIGLLNREDWKAEMITAPWAYPLDIPQAEELFRRSFHTQEKPINRARLYITARGVYEAEINGKRVGDHFLAPGWTVYDKRLQYQTYDVTECLLQNAGANVIGVRVAEGWYCGRVGFDGGNRHIWGDRPALLAQLELLYSDGTSDMVITDSSWVATKGPIVLAELYNGEKYDARLEISGWSTSLTGWSAPEKHQWEQATAIGPPSTTIQLLPQSSEPVRRIEAVKAIQKIVTPSGKVLLDFGQNLVGYIRVKRFKGPRGHKITLSHAEVLERGELGRRPLRTADSVDVFILKGDENGESWEPRFTFHGFRYVQLDGWLDEGNADLLESFEAVVCHTDMVRVGHFNCSDSSLSQLYENVVWSMRGNFLSIPTDCPQRDERLGWTGDLALFAPTANLLYNCAGIVKSWLDDLIAEQSKHGGVPPMVVPNILEKHPIFGRVQPAAIWCDAAVLVPWALYQATGDVEILQNQFQSMTDWLSTIPKNKEGNIHLWDDSHPQLGDWLDPVAPPDKPNAAKTDAVLVSNAYLIRSLELVAKAAQIIGKLDDAVKYEAECQKAREEFASEYLSSNGRLMSDSQTGYALAIVFNLIPSEAQMIRASERLSFIVRRNAFKIGTGFAGTPFICEALVQAQHLQVAYSMLLNKDCPSWLYPVSMGATTVWERWDSMLPDNSINPGEMTSFNHYAFGAVARFLSERIAGIQSAAPGWRRFRVAPLIGGDLTYASASLDTPYGRVSSSWRLAGDEMKRVELEITIPPNTSAEIVFPEGTKKDPMIALSGNHSFSLPFSLSYEWPVEPLREY